jgi:hypothetical protein
MNRLVFRYRIPQAGCPPGGYAGALHCHTIASDGRKTLEELVELYRGLGFSFMCVADHGHAGNNASRSTPGFLILDGMEATARTDRRGQMHVLVVNVRSRSIGLVVGLRRLIESLPKGAMAFAAHPHWTNTCTQDVIGHGLHGVELYNYACHRQSGKAYGVAHWDATLAAGEDLLGIATDDTHGSDSIRDWGGGWVGVFAPRLDKRSIMAALRRGNYYSSNGPAIYDLTRRVEHIRIYRIIAQIPLRFLNCGLGSG